MPLAERLERDGLRFDRRRSYPANGRPREQSGDGRCWARLIDADDLIILGGSFDPAANEGEPGRFRSLTEEPLSRRIESDVAFHGCCGELPDGIPRDTPRRAYRSGSVTATLSVKRSAKYLSAYSSAKIESVYRFPLVQPEHSSGTAVCSRNTRAYFPIVPTERPLLARKRPPAARGRGNQSSICSAILSASSTSMPR